MAKSIGRYQVLSQIGAGGMGEVYLAKDAELERTVALKVLPEDVARPVYRVRYNQIVYDAVVVKLIITISAIR